MKKLKKYTTALPFLGALLMLCFEAQPGPGQLVRQMCTVLPAIALLAWTAVLSRKYPASHDNDPQ